MFGFKPFKVSHPALKCEASTIKSDVMSDVKITKKMPITEVVEKYPETVSVFAEHGLHCIGCIAARFENIEQGAAAHGVDADKLVAELNKAVEKE